MRWRSLTTGLATALVLTLPAAAGGMPEEESESLAGRDDPIQRHPKLQSDLLEGKITLCHQLVAEPGITGQHFCDREFYG